MATQVDVDVASAEVTTDGRAPATTSETSMTDHNYCCVTPLTLFLVEEQHPLHHHHWYYQVPLCDAALHTGTCDDVDCLAADADGCRYCLAVAKTVVAFSAIHQ